MFSVGREIRLAAFFMLDSVIASRGLTVPNACFAGFVVYATYTQTFPTNLLRFDSDPYEVSQLSRRLSLFS